LVLRSSSLKVRMLITIVLLRYLESKVIRNCRGKRKLRLYKLSKSRNKIDFRDRSRFFVIFFYYCFILSFKVFRNLFGKRSFDRNEQNIDYNIFNLFVLFKDRNFVIGPFSFKLIIIISFVIIYSFFFIKV
jgi:hypothetical protein